MNNKIVKTYSTFSRLGKIRNPFGFSAEKVGHLKAPFCKGAFLRCTVGICMAIGGWFVQPVVAQPAVTDSVTEKSETETVYRLSEYLQLGPLPFALPAFRGEVDINGKAFSQTTLFEYPFFGAEFRAGARPVAGEKFDWSGEEKVWKQADSETEIGFTPADSNWNAWILNAFYLRAPSYGKATVELAFAPAFELYMDGIRVLAQESAQDTAVPQSQKAVLNLEPGYHVFMLKSLCTGTEKSTRFDVSFKTKDMPLEVGAEVREFYGLRHYLDGATVFSPQLSHSGAYFKLSFNQADPKARKYESVHRIYRTADADARNLPEPILELTGVSGLQFASGTDKYAYMKKNGSSWQIYAGNLGEPARKVYETTDNLSGFTWDPKGRYLILDIYTQGEEPKNGLRQMHDPMDQWPYYRTRTALSKLDLASGTRIPLTYGYLSTSLLDISSDGRYLLFATSEAVDTMRLYMLQKVYRMDVETLAVDELFRTYFPGNASFSPDGTKLLVTGSEQIFEDPSKPGVSVPCQDCFIPNDYEVNAFIFDIATRKVVPITKDFGPSLQNGKWEASGRYIYFSADDHDRVNLYTYRVSDGKFIRIPARIDVVNGFDICAGALLYTGSSIDKPFQACLIKGSAEKGDFASAQVSKKTFLVADPQGEELARVAIGENRDWTYVNAEGDTIEAVYYLPPDFDPAKKYPCIVYYYSGTTPTPRALSMRYPKSVWSSNGFVVLVLQPSGAIGFNRDFSAKHVNNWGITVADEIISGVRRFCREHDYVDSTKLGCIGASYGGFMTQLLVTRTDLFAAAISHAGISSISSYWGEGYWGYLYGSTANAFAFPWNRKDIFVDQSPLFNADKVHTPLLLLHGTSDVNVPIGESYQMYKALRLLGRPVAMVTVAGEDHGIVDYAKRTDWEKTILAWFEKYLKGKPQWWDSLYPAKKM